MSWIDVNYCFTSMEIEKSHDRLKRQISKYPIPLAVKLKSKVELGNEQNKTDYYVVDYNPDQPTGNTLAISTNDDDWATYHFESVDPSINPDYPDNTKIYQIIGGEKFYWTVSSEADGYRLYCNTTEGTIEANSENLYYQFSIEGGIAGLPVYIKSQFSGDLVRMVTSEGVLKAVGSYKNDRSSYVVL